MYSYSKASATNRLSCHSNLQFLFWEVLKTYDHSILCGHRGKKEQEKAFENKQSEIRYPFSKHNKKPSLAVDVAPYPIDWDNLYRFYHFSGFVCGVADRLLAEGVISHKIRWGGDWNGNRDFSDQDFNDLVHYELIGG